MIAQSVTLPFADSKRMAQSTALPISGIMYVVNSSNNDICNKS